MAPRGKGIWIGRVLSGLMGAFLVLDAVMKFGKPAPVAEAMTHLGWSLSATDALGVVLLSCTVLYLIPQTSVLGAILLTGYLGGAVATHMRVGDPLFQQALFPVYVGVALWGGLYLRNERVRALMPITRKGDS